MASPLEMIKSLHEQFSSMVDVFLQDGNEFFPKQMGEKAIEIHQFLQAGVS